MRRSEEDVARLAKRVAARMRRFPVFTMTRLLQDPTGYIYSDGFSVYADGSTSHYVFPAPPAAGKNGAESPSTGEEDER